MKNRHARIRRALFVLLTLALLCAAIFGPVYAQADLSPTPEGTAEATVPAARPADPRFGVIESFEDPSRAGQLGVGWTRVRFQWAETQPDGPDDWQPPIADEQLATELAAGREVVGLLIGLPEWARDRRGLPRGLDLPPDDPDNAWAVFVGDVVARYAGRIDRWIIWNEPDIDDRDAPGHTWDGTIEEFFQLQRVAYLAAKAANSDAAVHLGAFTFFWDPGYFSRLLDIIAADPDAAANNYYFDVATAHLYFQPNAVYNVLYAFRRVMDAHGLDQPIWLVETNAPPMDDPYWVVDNWTLAVSLNEQAAFVPQAIAAAISAGAERIAVYKLKDTESDRAANPEPFGLIRWDNSRRPAFTTYRVAIELLAGVTAAERERWDAVGQVRLEQKEKTTTVLFARLPGSQQARVEAIAGTAELVDMWGRGETIEARGGYFVVDLPGALCLQTIADYCMIGGTTYYLVQQVENSQADEEQLMGDKATLGSDASPTPRPSPSTTPSPTVAPASTSTVALSATPMPSPTMTPSATLTRAATGTAAPTLTATPDADGTTVEVRGDENKTLSDYAGLGVLGLGLALGAGLAVWAFGRRGG
jgi:hypothetical protein